MWRSVKDQTSNNYNFCSSKITCKIKNNKEVKYCIDKWYSKDCNIYNYSSKNEDSKAWFISKMKDYNNNKLKLAFIIIKNHAMYIYWFYKYNLYFQINDNMIKNIL